MDNKGLLPKKDNGLLTKDGVSFLIPFLMITSCFALWGFANDVTSPMVKAFSKIFRMSVTEGAMVQVAFCPNKWRILCFLSWIFRNGVSRRPVHTAIHV